MTLGLSASSPKIGDPVGRLYYLTTISQENSWKRLGIGRAASNEIVIDDPAVSEFHCFVKKIDGNIMIGDLASTNGTQLNGEFIVPPQMLLLEDQFILTIGRLSFEYYTPETLYQYLQLCPEWS
jgi:hypothetical protein